MMRKCHLNTCPVGVATQDPVLRKRFKGAPEHVINFFFFLAEDVREIMASLGVARFDDLVGRSDWLDKKQAIDHWKAKGLDFSRIFYKPDMGPEVAIRHVELQQHPIDTVLDRTLIAKAQGAIERGEPVVIESAINNVDRSTGAMLSGQVAKRYGYAGLPDDTITVKLTGTAGQSFGAWVVNGVTLELTGQANDYVGKGLSGGKLVIKPSPDARPLAEQSIIVGNTVLYGAISRGMLFPRRRGRALRGAQFRRDRGGRGHRRPWLRIHDRRRRRRARPDRAKLRGRHVGRRRLCARRGQRASPSAATSPWSISSRSPRRRS